MRLHALSCVLLPASCCSLGNTLCTTVPSPSSLPQPPSFLASFLVCAPPLSLSRASRRLCPLSRHERRPCVRSLWHFDAEWRVVFECVPAVERQRRLQQGQGAHTRIPRRAQKSIQQKYHQGRDAHRDNDEGANETASERREGTQTYDAGISSASAALRPSARTNDESHPASLVRRLCPLRCRCPCSLVGCAVCARSSCVCVLCQSADMNHELQSEAIDLIVSAIDKQRGNYEVTHKAHASAQRTAQAAKSIRPSSPGLKQGRSQLVDCRAASICSLLLSCAVVYSTPRLSDDLSAEALRRQRGHWTNDALLLAASTHPSSTPTCSVAIQCRSNSDERIRVWIDIRDERDAKHCSALRPLVAWSLPSWRCSVAHASCVCVVSRVVSCPVVHVCFCCCVSFSLLPAA